MIEWGGSIDDFGKTSIANGEVHEVEKREEFGAEEDVAVENANVVGDEIAMDVAHDAADEWHEVHVVSFVKIQVRNYW